jgi:hypothetical protein
MTERPFPRDLSSTDPRVKIDRRYAKQLRAAIERANKALCEGQIRTEIPCDEARREWINMARIIYVENNPDQRWPIDFEIGIHIARCKTDVCQNLFQVYFGVLKPSKPEDSSRVAEIIDSLERSMFPNP